MEYVEHFVDFHRWCKKCKYRHRKEFQEPCDHCLEQPVNTESRKPILFEEKIGGYKDVDTDSNGSSEEN